MSGSKEVELRLHRGQLQAALRWAVPAAVLVGLAVAWFGVGTDASLLRSVSLGAFAGVAVGVVVAWLRYGNADVE